MWYGLDLLVHTARKEWPWKQKQNRLSKTFSDCVTVGDEALALQIIKLCGKVYVEFRNKKAAGDNIKISRGRKKGEDMADMALTTKYGVYDSMRNMVKRIRTKNPNDELGWNGYLSDQMNIINSTAAIGSMNGRKDDGLIGQDVFQEMDIEI